MEQSHAGLYTCRLSVLINQQQFKVSRVILLHVEGGHAFTARHVVRELVQGARTEAVTWGGPPSSGRMRAAHRNAFQKQKKRL